jgi:hypothetical protein
VSNLLYLLAAVGLSAIGSTVLYLRHRRPTSMESGMKEFNRGLEALDPSRARPHGKRQRIEPRPPKGARRG